MAWKKYMTESLARAYDALNQELERDNMLLCAAEIHGMLSGLVASGAPLKREEWQGLMVDLANEGQAFSVSMKSLLSDIFAQVESDLADPQMGFQLLLPGDEEPLAERLRALTGWVQSFLVGFGVNQQHLAQASDDLREAIDDLAEIARLSDDVEADNEGERAFYEVTEYVRISAIMCFNELAGLAQTPTPGSTSLH